MGNGFGKERGKDKSGFPCMEGDKFPKAICVLLVVYDKGARRAFANRLRVLKVSEMVIQESESPAVATKMVEAGFRPHAIFCDLEMPGGAGKSFFRWLCDQYPDLAKGFCFLVDGEGGSEAERGVGRCVGKDANEIVLREMLKALLTR